MPRVLRSGAEVRNGTAAARCLAALAAAVVVVLLVGGSSAAAQELRRPPSLDQRPDQRLRTGAEVARTALADPEVRTELRDSPGAIVDVFLRDGRRWQVSWYEQAGIGERRREIVQAIVDDRSGETVEVWTGFRVAWRQARGYDGAFGRGLNNPLVWVVLLLAFTVPFVDRRRVLCRRNLDLIVLAGFSATWALFNAGRIELSTPLAYPLLAYLLARMLGIGLPRLGRSSGRRPPEDPPPLLVPLRWLAGGIVVLAGCRVGLNLLDSNVIDVGWASVVGADRLADGEPLYGSFPEAIARGDTYGPLAYAAYLPFAGLLPWNGSPTDIPAAHAAAIVFDLLTLGGVILLGRRAGGNALGIALGYAWVAFPFTALALNTNANDGLVALLVVATLLVATSAPARGALAGLAALTKLAPLALAPLLLTHGLADRPPRERIRRAALFATGFAGAVAAVCLLTVDDLGTFADRTFGFQVGRDTPFSIWGLYDLGSLQRVAQAAVVLGAVVLAVVPRRDDLVGLAALCAAVLIALQLATGYWFHLYLVWMVPPLMLALLYSGQGVRRPSTPIPAAATAGTSMPAHESASTSMAA